jgi:hypothetical protein
VKIIFIAFFVCACNWALAQQNLNDSIVKIDSTKWEDYGMRIYDARLKQFYNPTLFVSDSMANVYGWKRTELPFRMKRKGSL